jgi:TRAP-type uncharacterized transport system substrate-binding protein
MEPENLRALNNPNLQRSRLMLEVASAVLPRADWPDKQVEIRFRPQGTEDWKVTFFASDGPESIDAVVSGQADFAICNPGGILAMALHGAGLFTKPVPVRAIMVLPQFDQLAFCVPASSGLTKVSDIAARHYPLKVSMRGGRPNHSLHLMTNLVFSKFGFSLDDIVKWGGMVRYDNELPNGQNRVHALGRGEIDCVIDEATDLWGDDALKYGGRFLPIDEPQLQELESQGLKRVAIAPDQFPSMPEAVWTVDFSGWPVFCLESTPDRLVTAFCEGLERRKDAIPWYDGNGRPLDLKMVTSDTREAPMAIPLHPAAEVYWRQRGYLS